MKDFARLFTRIDQSTKTTIKVAALAEFFQSSTEEDRLWTIALFSGRRPKRAVTTTRLREWAAERAGYPLWLFEEAYPIVGDLAETIALFLPLHHRIAIADYLIGSICCVVFLRLKNPRANRRCWRPGMNWTQPSGFCSTS